MIIEQYAQEQGWEKKWSKQVVSTLNRYFIEIEDFKELEESSTFYTLAAKLNRRRKEVEPRTYNIEVDIIRRFLASAPNVENLEKLMKILKRLPEKQVKNRIPTEDEVETLLTKVKESEDEALYAALMILRYTMCRIGEALNLKWRDIDLTNNIIYFRTGKTGGRGSREDRIPLNKTLAEYLQNLWFNLEHQDDDHYVIPGRNGERRTHMYYGLRKYTGLGFHSIRHYGATRLAMKGVPLLHIKELLRHQSIETTKRYLQGLMPELRDSIERL